jgi:hypothetical protein
MYVASTLVYVGIALAANAAWPLLLPVVLLNGVDLTKSTSRSHRV